MSELERQIAKIIRDGITFSPQVGDYVIHGAIEGIKDLITKREDEAMSQFCQWLTGHDIKNYLNEYREFVSNKKSL